MCFQFTACFILLLFAVKCELQLPLAHDLNESADLINFDDIREPETDVSPHGNDTNLINELNVSNSSIINAEGTEPSENEKFARFNKDVENILENDPYIINRTFAEYKNAEVSNCGGFFTHKQTIIESPNYPENYPKNALCNYVFQTQIGKNCEFHLQFLDFELESSASCTKDRLQIHNSVLCGRTIGIRKYRAENGILSLKFSSDDNIENRGFRILITKLPCDDRSEETTTQDFILSTTNPDSEYEDDVTTTITPDTTTYITSQVYPVYSDPNTTPMPVINNTLELPNSVFSSRQFNPLVPGFGLPIPPLDSQPCCANAFNLPRFYLGSPGFPKSNQQLTNCAYYIYPSGPNICGLRIKFKYFWSGEESNQYGCNKGFIQIDDRQICGCKTGISLDFQWRPEAPKVIYFRNEGFPRTFYSGFVLDITQLPCPTRYLGNARNIVVNKLNVTRVQNFHEFEDKFNRVAFPATIDLSDDIEFHSARNGDAAPISKGTEYKATLEPPKYEHKDFLSRNYNNVIQPTNLYNNYIDPQAEYINPLNINRDLFKGSDDNVEIYYFEEPTNVKTESEAEFLERSEGYNPKFFLPHNENICRLWGFIHWTLLAAETLWIRRPVCQSFIVNNIRQINPNTNDLIYQDGNINPLDNVNIQIVNQIYGQFSSPNFPLPYPNNVNLVYRILRVPGFCGIKVVFVEFDLEQSFNCAKDKLIIGNQVYCGTYLQNKYFTFNTVLNQFYDLRFISDNFNSRRGFVATYEHCPC